MIPREVGSRWTGQLSLLCIISLGLLGPVHPQFDQTIKMDVFMYSSVWLHCPDPAIDPNASLTTTTNPPNVNQTARWEWTPGRTLSRRATPPPVIQIFSTDGFHPREWVLGSYPQLYVTRVRLLANRSLNIQPMRGSLLGHWACVIGPVGQPAAVNISLAALSRLSQIYVYSLAVGFTSLTCTLLFGVAVGLVVWLRENVCGQRARRLRAQKSAPAIFTPIIPVPIDEADWLAADQDIAALMRCVVVAAGGGVGTGVGSGGLGGAPIDENAAGSSSLSSRPVSGDSHPSMASSSLQRSELMLSTTTIDADIDLVFTDARVAAEYQTALDRLADSQGDPLRFSERVEALQNQLRLDVGRRVRIARTRMRSLKAESACRVSRAVQTLGSTSALAAQKMRSGLANSVGAVKGQMRSVAELCGSVHVGQTISIVSITRQGDGEPRQTVLKNYSFQ